MRLIIEQCFSAARSNKIFTYKRVYFTLRFAFASKHVQRSRAISSCPECIRSNTPRIRREREREDLLGVSSSCPKCSASLSFNQWKLLGDEEVRLTCLPAPFSFVPLPQLLGGCCYSFLHIPVTTTATSSSVTASNVCGRRTNGGPSRETFYDMWGGLCTSWLVD